MGHEPRRTTCAWDKGLSGLSGRSTLPAESSRRQGGGHMGRAIEDPRAENQGAARRPLAVRLFSLENWRRALHGDPLAFSAIPSPPEAPARVRAAQLSAVARNAPVMMLGACVSGRLFLSLSWGGPHAGAACFWAAALIGLSGVMWLERLRQPRPAAEVSVRGVRVATFYALAHGALWGGLPALFFLHALATERVLIACLSIGAMFGGAFALSAIPVAAFAFVAPVVGGATIGMAAGGDPAYTAVVGLLVIYAAVLILAVTMRARTLAAICADGARKEQGAITDELTRLPNRSHFREMLARALENYHTAGEPFALMCFDLDGFKAVNDTMGHAAGDHVLVEAAARLRATTRKHDVIARIGGDEFALITTGVGCQKQAPRVAERIVEAFSAPFLIEGQAREITISIGVAQAPVDGDDMDTLLRNADSALYATKDSGRAGFTFFRERFAFVSERATLESELVRAMANEELFLVFQPFADAATLRTKGFEALLRWSHPRRGVLGAGQIVPLLERGGLIEPVGAWAIGEAVRIAASWPPPLRLAVNVSAVQLRRPGFAESLRKALAANAFEPSRLELELTESALLLDRDKTLETLRALRDLGVRIALDDLGAGYASLANLASLPLDRLKIDRSFVADMLANPARQSMVKIAVQLARAMGLAITAEGVETREQLGFLRGLGPLEAQGYLIGAPRPAGELADLHDSCAEEGLAELALALAS